MTTKTVLLHIGPHKSGTTTIQALLARNEKPLRARGEMNFVEAGRIWPMQNINLAWQFVNTPRFQPSGGGWTDARAEIDVSACRLHVISSELISHFKPQDVDQVAKALQGLDVQVVFYARRPDLWLESLYVQNLKTLSTDETADAFIQRMMSGNEALKIGSLLDMWAERFGRGAIRLRVMERRQMVDGDLLADFRRTAGLDAIEMQPPEDGAQNISPGAKTSSALFEAARAIRRKGDASSWERLQDLYGAVIQDFGAARGWDAEKTRVIGLERAVEIMDALSDEHAAAARTYLGRDDGQLFQEPVAVRGAPASEGLPQLTMEEVFDLLAFYGERVEERFAAQGVVAGAGRKGPAGAALTPEEAAGPGPAAQPEPHGSGAAPSASHAETPAPAAPAPAAPDRAAPDLAASNRAAARAPFPSASNAAPVVSASLAGRGAGAQTTVPLHAQAQGAQTRRDVTIHPLDADYDVSRPLPKWMQSGAFLVGEERVARIVAFRFRPDQATLRTRLAEAAQRAYADGLLADPASTFVLVDLSNEAGGVHHLAQDCYAEFSTETGVPMRNLLYAAQNRRCRRYLDNPKRDPATLPIWIPFDHFLHEAAAHALKVPDAALEARIGANVTAERLFMCLNRKMRGHRIALIALLVEKGLYGANHIAHEALLEPESEEVVSAAIERFPGLADAIRALVKDGGLAARVLPSEQSGRMDVVHGYPTEERRDTLFNLVTETDFFTKDVLRLTEKTMKPMAHGHPSLILAPPDTLAYAQSLGFQMDYGLIPPEYDAIPDPEERMRRVVDALVELETDRVRKGMRSVVGRVNWNAVRHNWRHLRAELRPALLREAGKTARAQRAARMTA